MEVQQRRWLECDRGSQDTVRPDPQRTETGDQPIANAQIWCPTPAPVQNQQLMSQYNGLGHDRPDTSGPENSENRHDSVEQKNSGIAHPLIVPDG